MLGLFTVLTIGCSGGLQGIATLRNYSSNHGQIAQQVKIQQKLFRMLIADIDKKNIKAGLSYSDLLRRYGEPILVWNTDGASLVPKKVLYRDPVKYFNTDKVYLYFDSSDSLVKWEDFYAEKIN